MDSDNKMKRPFQNQHFTQNQLLINKRQLKLLYQIYLQSSWLLSTGCCCSEASTQHQKYFKSADTGLVPELG